MPKGPGGVIFWGTAMEEPKVKRAVAFFDGQNLYHHAKAAFGHHHPNYDPIALATALCRAQGWANFGVRFYTGIPTSDKDEFWHKYWSRRLLAMRRAGILVVSRPLRYHTVHAPLADGSERLINVPQEKGIDVRLALDVIRMTLANQLDVALVFSQDQDLAELAKEIREISRSQNRWIKIACAFPDGPNATARRGIDGADWIKVDEETYNACLDKHDYRQS